MKKVLIVAAVVFIAAGCAPSAQYPDMTINTLQDNHYPCLKVVFPDSVKLEDMKVVTKDNESLLLYTLSMNSRPAYEISVIKRRTSSVDVEWSLVPISDQYDNTVKFYEISPSDMYFDRSAVVVLDEKNSQIVLRGVVGEYVTQDTVYMVRVDRVVQKDGYLHLFSVEKWANSSAGKRIIADMKEQVDWYYDHTEVLDCNIRPRVDKMWWE